MKEIDIVVIGGGPAGLAAALGAKKSGAKSILLLERDKILGGILNQCIHDGFGLFMFNEALSGPEFAENLIDRLLSEKIPYETEAMVLDITPQKIVKYNSPSGYKTVKAKAVILAMGCRERTRGMIGIPGTRPAGVMTAGSAQNLVNMQNLKIGKKVVILGSGDIGLIMARRLTLEGMKVIGVYEIMPWCNGLDRNVRQCLNDYAIPLYLSTTVTKIHGYNRVEAITVNRVDKNGEILPNTEERISCDTLLLSVGLIPENELSRRAGAKLSPITKGPLVNDRLMTTVPGIFSCGNVLHIHDVADFAAEEGFKAGERAANYTAEEKKNDEETIGIHVGKNIRYCLPQRISKGITGIDISFRVSIPLNNQTLIIRDMKNGEELFHKQYVRILPSELEKITLKQPVNHELEVFCHEC